MSAKKSKGRQRIEMKKITNSEARQVCFSKRRLGLFKKANELSTLTGAEVAVVVFSPGGRAFAYGQPSVDRVADRFLGNGSEQCLLPTPVEMYRSAVVQQMSHQVMDLEARTEAQKAQRAVLEKRLKAARGDGRNVVPERLEGLGLEELEAVAERLSAVKVRADERVREILCEAAASSNIVGVPPPMAVAPIRMMYPFGNGGFLRPPQGGFVGGNGLGFKY